MKTTIDIADPLLKQAKRQALSDDVTLKMMVEEGLRLVLERKRKEHRSFHLRPLKTVGGGLTPAFQNAGWDRIRDAIYD